LDVEIDNIYCECISVGEKKMRWPLRRVIEELILVLFGMLWVFVISDALQNAYPFFPLLFLE